MAYIKDGCYCSDDNKEDEKEYWNDKDKDCCYATKHPQPKKILGQSQILWDKGFLT